VEDRLLHASGLPAWLPLFREHHGEEAFARAIASAPLGCPPRSRSIYSDLGFMMLGFVLEAAGGRRLDELFHAESERLDLGDIRYLPPNGWRARTAPTEYDDWRGRLLVGEVHDENAAALDGVAAHAGLFGTAAAIGRFARLLLRTRRGDVTGFPASRATIVEFTTRHDVPGSSRALGWDTMLPTSSCGTEMSPLAFGHTGFTGTSLWLDPSGDLYAVLLANPARRQSPNARTDKAPSDIKDEIVKVRPAFHDAVMRAIARKNV
jgi:CubicO group peptidase (beta-lactamase class C family)